MAGGIGFRSRAQAGSPDRPLDQLLLELNGSERVLGVGAGSGYRPVGPPGFGQILWKIVRRGERLEMAQHGQVLFVPLLRGL